MPKTKISLAISTLILATLACNAVLPAEPTSTPVIIFEPTNPSQPSDLPVTEEDVPRIPLEAAYTAYTSGAAIIVDVRSVDSYNASHVPNALSIPLENFELNIDAVNLDKDQWIITYCT